jgi:hypothetical protein
MALDSPLKILDRLVATISAYGRTSTLTKFPIVSSTTSKTSYLSANPLRRGISAERRSGFDGNSVKRARIGGFVGSILDSSARRLSRVSMSESSPRPKKWAPGPHFSRILRVSMYGNLRVREL